MRLPFQSDRELRSSLFSVLGFYPHRIHYYRQALLHKSTSSNSKSRRGENNERLEFLGDAILDAVVGDIVFHYFPGKGEGFLTNTRSKIVQRSSLNHLSAATGLSRLIRSNSHSNAHNSYMGGNAFEALIGAVYLDRGYDAVMHFIRHHVLGHYINIDDIAAEEVNFKSKLIEWCQKHRLNLEFRLTDERTDNGSSPVFVSRAVIEGIECETGQGYSKKESHQHAAHATLRALHADRQTVNAIFLARERRTTTASESKEEDITDEIAEEEDNT